jgi:hypothetical protein
MSLFPLCGLIRDWIAWSDVQAESKSRLQVSLGFAASIKLADA